MLWHELDRAKFIDSAVAPETFVRMGCEMTVHEVTSDEVYGARLVYPSEATEPGLISVTSRLGAALIGLPIGEDFQWTAADGRDRIIRILSVEPPGAVRRLALVSPSGSTARPARQTCQKRGPTFIAGYALQIGYAGQHERTLRLVGEHSRVRPEGSVLDSIRAQEFGRHPSAAPPRGGGPIAVCGGFHMSGERV